MSPDILGSARLDGSEFRAKTSYSLSTTSSGPVPTGMDWFPKNTGPRKATTLRKSSILTVDDEVISGARFPGLVDVRAKRVKLIDFEAPFGIKVNNEYIKSKADRITLSHGLIDGSQADGALAANFYYAEYCEITNGADGCRCNSSSELYACYVHDLYRKPGSHDDCAQSTQTTSGTPSDVKITYNYLKAYKDSNNDHMNSSYLADVSGVTFENNWCDGGNITIQVTMYGGANSISNNIFTRRHAFGAVKVDLRAGTLKKTGNRYEDGTPIIF